MGKKIIITESQIETLKVLLEREMGIEESVLIDRRNPFKWEAYKYARQPYNSNMKDGDFFYLINETEFKNYVTETKKICEELRLQNIEKYKNAITKFQNKTIRQGDKIFQIGEVKTELDGFNLSVIVKIKPLESDNFGGYDFIDYKTNYYGQGKGDLNLPTIQVTNVDKPYDLYSLGSNFTLPLEKANGGPLNLNLTDFCFGLGGKEYINQNIQKLPDEVFEIRKVVRQQTDF